MNSSIPRESEMCALIALTIIYFVLYIFLKNVNVKKHFRYKSQLIQLKILKPRTFLWFNWVPQLDISNKLVSRNSLFMIGHTNKQINTLTEITTLYIYQISVLVVLWIKILENIARYPVTQFNEFEINRWATYCWFKLEPPIQS